MKKAYRQGELIFVPRNEEIRKKHPDDNRYSFGAEKKENNIIREGEITGHCHVAEKGELFINYENLILVNNETTPVVHPEHKVLKLPAKGEVNPVGEIDIIIQREYDEVKDRNVMD